MDAEAFESIRRRHLAPYTHNYSEKDVILYALALGARAQDLHLVYEGDPSFTALPMYSIIAAHPCLNNIPLEEYVPGFSRMRALHGEQYLRVLRPLPTHGQLITQPQLVDVRDKGQGKGAVIVVRSITKDALLGHDVAENEFVIYGLGAGGFGSPWSPAPRSPAAVAANQPPNRPPDKEVFLHTSPQQAAFYRLCGDLNPLHIDPAVAKKVGFSKPILHGLCTMGLSVKAVMQAMAGGNFGALRTAKVRFSKPCLPGDVLRVRMWKLTPTPTNSPSAYPYANPAPSLEGAVEGVASPPLVKVVFETRIMGAEGKEGTVVIAGAAVEFEGDRPHSKL